eukprot:COSAG02_NODE_6906_length_3296_cov_2.229903_2_plen_107_part_00
MWERRGWWKTYRDPAQLLVRPFCIYFSDVLFLNGEYDAEKHEAIVKRVHKTLGMDLAQSELICAAMSARLPGELEPSPELSAERAISMVVEAEPEPEPETEPILWL